MCGTHEDKSARCEINEGRATMCGTLEGGSTICGTHEDKSTRDGKQTLGTANEPMNLLIILKVMRQLFKSKGDTPLVLEAVLSNWRPWGLMWGSPREQTRLV